MTAPVTIVGGGASAVHAALTLLERGTPVRMIDVGRRSPPAFLPEAGFEAVKDQDGDRYFLGEDFHGAVLPGAGGEYYGFPPSKDHVFRGVAPFHTVAEGFAPLSSFAAGGLAEAWTGGSYPYTEAELAGFGVPYATMQSAYDLIARRIGITGRKDDLEAFIPVHEHLLPPLRLDEHSRAILAVYERRRARIIAKHQARLGHSRVAVLPQDLDDRQACDYRGRCLYGCPRGALYTPSATLRRCLGFAHFEYLTGRFVDHLVLDAEGRVSALACRDPESGGEDRSIAVDRVVLAAGALATARIVLETFRRKTGALLRLEGLMDNRQVLMPFLNLRRLGRRPDLDSYQYHQLAIGIGGDDALDHLHGQITTLKTALIHPIVSGLPLDLGTALRVFRRLHAALGLLNVNFSDTRRATSYLTLDPERPARGGGPSLAIRYEPPGDEAARIARGLRRFRAVLRALGCVVPPGMTHVRPMGASVHYAGTLPVSGAECDLTTTPDGRLRGFRNVWVVDGSVFPTLPAKQLTFTMMANASRVADEIAR